MAEFAVVFALPAAVYAVPVSCGLFIVGPWLAASDSSPGAPGVEAWALTVLPLSVIGIFL